MQDFLQSPIITPLAHIHRSPHSLDPPYSEPSCMNSPYSTRLLTSPKKTINNPYKENPQITPLKCVDNNAPQSEPSSNEKTPKREGLSQRDCNHARETKQLQPVRASFNQAETEKTNDENKDNSNKENNYIIQENVSCKQTDEIFCLKPATKRTFLHDLNGRPRLIGRSSGAHCEEHFPPGMGIKQKRVRRYTIEDYLHVNITKADFGVHTMGQVVEENLDITNRTNRNVLVQIEVDCFNPELQETEEYIFSVRRSYTQDYTDRHMVILPAFSTASFRLALKVPIIKTDGDIIGQTRIIMQGSQGMFTIGMSSKVVVPKVVCPKELYHKKTRCKIVKLAVKKGKKQETKFPLRNLSDVPVTIELDFYNPRGVEIDRQYCCVVYPNVITLPPKATVFTNLQVQRLGAQSVGDNGAGFGLENIKEVLVGKVINSSVFYSFALSVDLH